MIIKSKKILVLLFVCSCISSIVAAQKKDNRDDVAIAHILQKNIKFPEKEVGSGKSSIVFATLFAKDNGHIDSIIINSNTAFSVEVRRILHLTDGKWKKK